MSKSLPSTIENNFAEMSCSFNSSSVMFANGSSLLPGAAYVDFWADIYFLLDYCVFDFLANENWLYCTNWKPDEGLVAAIAPCFWDILKSREDDDIFNFLI